MSKIMSKMPNYTDKAMQSVQEKCKGCGLTIAECNTFEELIEYKCPGKILRNKNANAKNS